MWIRLSDGFKKGSQNQPRKYIVMHSIDCRIDITRKNLSFFAELKQQKKNDMIIN